MTDYSTIMAVNNNGAEITAGDICQWLKNPNDNKERLVEFIFNRLYGRYIKPFEFNDSNYKKNYKNGFTIMANCCLLIETFASFRKEVFKDTNGKSEKCFGWFFLAENKFIDLSKGGLLEDQYLSNDRIKNKGVPRAFYRDVRCGILHNGETRNGWKILRKNALYDENTKTINAVKFMNELKKTLLHYKAELNAAKTDSEIWTALTNRLEFLVSKT